MAARLSRLRFATLLILCCGVLPCVGDEASVDLGQLQRLLKQVRRDRDKRLVPMRLALRDGTSKADEKTKRSINVSAWEKSPSITDANEARELDLTLLSDTLDHAQTMLGRWAIGHATEPIADKNVVLARQKTVKTLAEQQELLRDMRATLAPLAKSENALYAYWGFSELFVNAKQLYFNAPQVPILYNIPVVKKCFDGICNFLNNRRATLEAAWAVDVFKALSFAAGVFGIRNAMEESFIRSMGWGPPDPNNPEKQADFNPVDAFVEGIKQPVRGLNPFAVLFKKGYGKTPVEFGVGLRAGSWGDRRILFRHGVKGASKISGPFKFFNKFSDWMNEPTDEPSTLRKVNAELMAGGMGSWTLISLAFTCASLRSTWQRLYVTMNGLQEHMTGVANAVGSMKTVAEHVLKSGLFTDEKILANAREALKQIEDGEIKKLLSLLSTSTFNGPASIFYFRGRVLRAHRELEKMKDKMLPLMRFVGEIDAYCSMAQLVASHKDHDARYCFVEFDGGAAPVVELKGFWTPLLESDLVFLLPEGVVTNDITIGGGTPRNILFTGPNGGGKSTVLKAIGHAIALAHSWGIAPAASARMSFFDGMRTCLDPREDLTRGISTFMASKAGMERLYEFTHNNPAPRRIITLIDEPYAGTVDDEMERRTGQFCNDITRVGNGIAVIATHVKPSFKAGAEFGFYHVDIAENGTDGFGRTYKVKSGLCGWWFDDAARRRRYIDWLNPSPGEKKNHEEMPAAACAA